MPRYLPVGTDDPRAQIFVAPSDEAQALLRRWPQIVGHAPGAPVSAGRVVRDVLVAPFTQLTFLSFDLQAFLFGVLHTSRFARMGHLVGMSGVVFFLMAQASAWTVSLPGVDGGGLLAGALLCWYAALARDARMSTWWFAMVPVVASLWLGSHAFLERVAGEAWWTRPWLWMLGSAAFVAFSHIAEPLLPPRIAHPSAWVSPAEYVLGPVGERHAPLRVVRRLGWLGCVFLIGVADELWAAPRLLPYNVLELMLAGGYAPERRRELRDRVDRALASGNPALDYVGIGGAAVLVAQG